MTSCSPSFLHLVPAILFLREKHGILLSDHEPSESAENPHESSSTRASQSQNHSQKHRICESSGATYGVFDCEYHYRYHELLYVQNTFVDCREDSQGRRLGNRAKQNRACEAKPNHGPPSRPLGRVKVKITVKFAAHVCTQTIPYGEFDCCTSVAALTTTNFLPRLFASWRSAGKGW